MEQRLGPVVDADGHASWIAAWLDRLDHKLEMRSAITPFEPEPGEYFDRQCVISADPDESMTAPLISYRLRLFRS